MLDSTDIEKKNLEAHVELCAERYRFLEEKLEIVEGKISDLNKTVDNISDMMAQMMNKRNDQILNWGIGIIGTLLAVLGFVVVEFVIK
jgi:DNA-binding transcriptional MerR regulator